MFILGEGKEKHRLASEIHVQWVKFRSLKAVVDPIVVLDA